MTTLGAKSEVHVTFHRERHAPREVPSREIVMLRVIQDGVQALTKGTNITGDGEAQGGVTQVIGGSVEAHAGSVLMEEPLEIFLLRALAE